MPVGCAIPAPAPFQETIRCARLADNLGYDSIHFSHIASREPFTMDVSCSQPGNEELVAGRQQTVRLS
jgi:hypothetical protein